MMIVIRIVLAVLGLYIIRLYIPPLISLGILNFGNVFGMLAGGVISAVGVFLPKLVSVINIQLNGDHRKATIASLSAICVLIIAFIIVFFATLGAVVSHSKKTAENQTTVIVLGCRIRGSIPSEALIQRCVVAANYLKWHPNAVAVASGGQGKDEDLSEGQCIYNLLTENGIDGERIFIEDKSTSTNENIAFSKVIIQKNNLSKEVAVATSEYHEKRAEMICKKNGLKAYSIPAPSSKWYKPTYFTREVFAIWSQLL